MAETCTGRRDFLKTVGGAALTSALSTGKIMGANDKVNVAFIGTGRMGSGNIGYAAKVPGFQIVAVCDVYQPALERAQAEARRLGFEGVKAVKDFREILADKSIDAVSIATPGPLARLPHRGSLQSRQGRVGRKAGLRLRGRRPEDGGGRAQVQARRAGRDHAALGRFLPEGARDRQERRPGRHHVLPHVPGRVHRRRKGSAIRPIPSRPPASTGTSGSAPLPSARSMPTAGVWAKTAGRRSGTSGITPAAP